MANELLSSLKILLTQFQQGEKNASDVVKNLNTWAREIGDIIKDKVEEEVERSVKKMGFVKGEDHRALEMRVQKLELQLKIATGKKVGRKNVKEQGARGVKKSSTSRVTKEPAKNKARKKSTRKAATR